MIGLSQVFVGALIIATCIPLREGKINMNRLYGIRFKKSYESEENWYKINRYGAQRLILWSKILIAIGIAIGILAIFLPVGEKGIILLASVPFIYVVPAIECWRFARKQ